MTVYFLFLESIGTPELILIALVALIVFGPRKLPSIGRQIGRYTSEFKRASNEFRRSWEYEVEMAQREDQNRQTGKSEDFSRQSHDFAANDLKDFSSDFAVGSSSVENTIGRTSARRTARGENSFAALNENNSIALPEVRHVSETDFTAAAAAQVEANKEKTAIAPSKREWL